jgi:hypothetical protein
VASSFETPRKIAAPQDEGGAGFALHLQSQRSPDAAQRVCGALLSRGP